MQRDEAEDGTKHKKTSAADKGQHDNAIGCPQDCRCTGTQGVLQPKGIICPADQNREENGPDIAQMPLPARKRGAAAQPEFTFI